MVDIVGIFPDLSFAKKRNDLKMSLKADQDNRSGGCNSFLSPTYKLVFGIVFKRVLWVCLS